MPVESVPPQVPPAGARRLAGLLGWALFLAWGLTLLRGTLSNGDAVVYLVQALDADLKQRTIHLGYILGLSSFLAGWEALVLPLLTEFRSLLPAQSGPHSRAALQTAQALGMNFFSLGWGLVGAFALNRLDLQLRGPSRYRGPLAALIWWSFPPILTAVTTGEIEAMMWALSLVSLWGWNVSRPLTAGLALGCALTVTPGAVGVLPALWCLTPQNSLVASPPQQRRLSAWGRLLLMALLPLAFTLWWGGEDYWRGPRGLLTAPMGISRGDALELRLGQLPAAWGLWALFLVPGFYAALTGAWTSGRRVSLALLATSLLTWAVLDRFRDIPAYGIPAALLALVMAQGLRSCLWPVPRLSGLSQWPSQAGTGAGNVMGGVPWPAAWMWGCLGVGVLQGVLADQAVRRERRKEADFAHQVLEERRDSRPDPHQESFSHQQLTAWYRTGRPAVLPPTAEGHPEERH